MPRDRKSIQPDTQKPFSDLYEQFFAGEQLEHLKHIRMLLWIELEHFERVLKWVIDVSI